MASRKATLLSPIRTSPLRSRIVTSPACRSLTPSSAMVFSFFRLLKAVEGFGFAFVYVKDSQELSDRQQVPKFLGEVEQFQLSAFFINGGVTGNQFADT